MFHPSRMRGTRAIELGSGPGLTGLTAAMLGATVELTDVASVVPLIHQNIRLNFESAAWARQVALQQQFGSATAAELDWTVPQQLSSFQGPYDLILCTDCVYHEHLVRDLARVVLHCSGSKTTGVAPILLLLFFAKRSVMPCATSRELDHLAMNVCQVLTTDRVNAWIQSGAVDLLDRW